MLELIETVRKSLQVATGSRVPGIISRDRIHAIRQVMDKLTPKDFLLKPPRQNSHYLSSFDTILYGAPKIVMVPVHQDKHFTIGLFFFPPKAKMPLHDHPNMTVFSRILYGKMLFKAFDWVPTHYKPPVTTNSHLRPKLAKMVANTIVTPSTPTHVTFGDHGGNVHSFSAAEPSALLDVIIPPYNDSDRQIAYFEEIDNDDENEDEEDDEYMDEYEDEDEDEVDENGKPVQKAWLLQGEPPEDYCCMTANEEDIDNYMYQPKT
eukprot:Phypoly_transcript_06164.p1 GENE.Phypoly_transcript_06164~~Phypoly_transcript_06164.p1  ORF type:complete len:263 (-),score=43.34 Phypoly_transcript_06164:88-876(-)